MTLLDSIKNLQAKFGAKKSTAIGLDISADGIVGSVINTTKNGYLLEELIFVPIPAGTIQDGEIVDQETVISAIGEMRSQLAGSSNQAVTAVAGQSSIIRLVNLPVMSQDELDNFLKFEAERYIPFSYEDVNLSSQILSLPEGDEVDAEMEVLIVAAQKNLVDTYLQVTQQNDVQLYCIDLASFAALRAFLSVAISMMNKPPRSF
jgi:type IV pilus assembly protein PilM